uniref:Uncharacterized protein n=1 Tax=Panagrolaimus sp. PS1159 TaxID=55785 RepID=A0AC35F0J6_9BILA
MRQRNSSVPIRQLIQRSRLSSLLAKRRNSTNDEDGDCAVCNPEACNERLLRESGEDLYCMKSINEGKQLFSL